MQDYVNYWCNYLLTSGQRYLLGTTMLNSERWGVTGFDRCSCFATPVLSAPALSTPVSLCRLVHSRVVHSRVFSAPTHGQCDARSTVIFRAYAGRYWLRLPLMGCQAELTSVAGYLLGRYHQHYPTQAYLGSAKEGSVKLKRRRRCKRNAKGAEGWKSFCIKLFS